MLTHNTYPLESSAPTSSTQVRARWRRLPRVVAAFLLLPALVACGVAAQSDHPTLANGDMEAGAAVDDAGTLDLAGWTGYRWEGQGRIVPVETAFSGRRSVLIEGQGPGKQAIFQTVALDACGYRLSARVAGRDLRPNRWNQGAAIYIDLGDQPQLLQDLTLVGDSDWRHAELAFALPRAAEATIYFFNYGSGSLFVDAVTLTRQTDCRGPETGFRLAESATKPLEYRRALSTDDLALRGYCDAPGYTSKPFCQAADPSLERSPRARAPLDITLTDRKPRRGAESAATRDAQHIPAGQYLSLEPAAGLPTDWRGHDWLTFEVNHSAPTPQTLNVEINDARSRDYWSRYNGQFVVPPGRTTLRVPLQGFVGELSVVGERRRLELGEIRRLVLSAADASADLEVTGLRLVPEPEFTSDFPRLLKFDAGLATSPLLSGFTPLTADTHYTPERGYGLSRDAQVLRAEDRRHPDDLLRDWISFNSGGLDFDLPNGRYHVWMMLEDPGYWEYYPNYRRRTVYAEGRPALEDTQDATGFWQRYYRHANDEDLPGDNVWQRYIRARYVPLHFAIEVSDGQLNLRFNAHDDPYALALSALVIHPAADAAQGTAFIAELWQRLHRHYTAHHRELPPPAPASAPPANALDGRLWLFKRGATLDVQATDWPDASELTDHLTLALAADETAPLTLSLRARVALDVVDIALDLPGFDIDAASVRYKLRRVSQDGSVYANVPRVLDPLAVSTHSPLRLTPETTRRLWFDLRAKPGLAAGVHQGMLRLRFADGSRHALPVSVTLQPWALPDADIPIGYLGTAPGYPGTTFPEVTAKREREFVAALPLLRRHGMTAVSGGLGGPNLLDYSGKRPRLDLSATDKSLAALRQHFAGPIDTYLGLELEGISTREVDDRFLGIGKNHAAVIKDVVAALRRHGERQGWPELIHVVGDEPDDAAVEQSLAVARAFRQAGAKTSIYTSLDSPRRDPRGALAGRVDHIHLNHHSGDAIRHIVASGSRCGLYNQLGRYRRGVYLFKLRELGCAGHMQFAFSSVHVDPWYDLDGREDDQVAVFTHPDGRLRETLELKRYREAGTDYRYLLKLEQLLQAHPERDRDGRARGWLDALMNRVEIGHATPSPWSDSELDRLRAEAAALINALVQAPARN